MSKNYSKQFKIYLDDLSKANPSPGGGSVVCLIFCIGISLIEKALNYSLKIKFKTESKRNSNLEKLVKVSGLRKKIYPYINRDGQIFELILKNKGTKRNKFIRESEDIIVSVGKSSQEAVYLAKKVKSHIKKSIMSDFDIGMNLIESALRGCIHNLEANEYIFGRKSPYTIIFKKYLSSNEGGQVDV